MPTRYRLLASLFVVPVLALAACGDGAVGTATPAATVAAATATPILIPPTVTALVPTATAAPPTATAATLPPSATLTAAPPTATTAPAAPTASPTPAPPARETALPPTMSGGASAVISSANVGALAVAWTQTAKAPLGVPVFAPDGRYVGFGDGAHAFHMLQTADGHETRAVAGDSGAFAPDGVTLATADNRAFHLWRLDTGAEEASIPLDPYQNLFVPVLAFAASGALLAAGADPSTNQIFLWSALPGATTPAVLEPEDSPEAFAFSPDRRSLAVGTANLQIEIWPVGGDTRVGESAPHGRGVNVLAWAPDGATVADASHEVNVHLWRAGDLSELTQLRSAMRVSALAFSPDGALLAVGTNTAGVSRDATANVVEIWDVGSGKRLRTLTGIEEGLTGVAFAPDGRTLVATTDAGTCRAWRVR